VNLGDIIIEDGDIYGNGVNVAARLEEIAEPGGICISSIDFEQIDGKVDQVFVDLGDQQVKNISKPVRVWGRQLTLAHPHPNMNVSCRIMPQNDK